MIPYDHVTIRTNNINLHVVQAGPKDGPLVILLHGFPEFWYGWRRQIDHLAAQGYRVWAPDQRGYNLSDKPAGINAYNLDELAADVIGLINAAGQEKTYLVGHDWGAAVAWWTASKFPERLKKLAILNVPHHKVFRKTLYTDWEQRRRSWYIAFFQIPFLPEALLGARNAEGFARALLSSSSPGTFSPDDLALYRQAWSQPGVTTAMLNWYRAIVRRPPASNPDPRIKIPTLILWGKNDIALKWEMAQSSVNYCDDGRVIYFENASHWLQHEEPDSVNTYLSDFLRP
ncbi:MAG: alpha/beta hydrolase [Anaerolineae bacterium]|nr:alpha/beta hydrolase [Anaerolineae bacterium]